ncbi:MAG TPA: CvpA family protein [Candidatus Limnocylindria bacterium]
MNAIDLLLVAAVVFAAASGVRAGFVATLYALSGWIVALVSALALLSPAAGLLASVGLTSPVARLVAFAVILIAVETLFAAVGAAVVVPFARRLHRDRALAVVDRAFGVLPSVLRMLVVAAIGLAAALVLPVGNEVRTAIDGSAIARALVAQVDAVQPQLGALTGEGEGAPLFVTRLAAEDSQTLDLPTDLALAADPDAERQMLALVNDERTARGLRPLELDERLVAVAREHSEEMLRLRYFGHRSPISGSPFDRLAQAGIRYVRAGENLAYTRSVTGAHRALMDSEGHRENVLRPEFVRVGIGVVSAGPYGRMFTQVFLTP